MESTGLMYLLNPFREVAMNTFSKKHYEMVASVMKRSRLRDDPELMDSKHYQPWTIDEQWKQVMWEFVREFKNDNERFNQEEFFKKCE